MRGELLTAPRSRNPKIPKALNDLVLRAMAPEVTARYARASDLLDDLIAIGSSGARPPRTSDTRGAPSDVLARLRSRDVPQPRFCWHCRKPLHARSDRCPFCGETQ
mgnify:CR=1 FL=1